MTQPTVEITLREIYDKQIEMSNSLHKIETVVDKVGDHENRLRRVEERQTKWTGGLIVISLLFAPIISLTITRIWG